MTMADRQPFVMLSILLYVTQTVPNGKLTQGKCGIGIGMVIAVTLLFESLLIVELLPGRQVLLGLALNQHSLVTGDGLAALRLEVLLTGLLPFLCHGARPDGAGEHAREGEDGKGTHDDGRGEEEDVAALIRGRGSAGTVGTKGNVVGSLLLLHGQLFPVGLHAVPKRHPQIGLLLWGHVLPSLLDVGEGRVGDGVGLAGLLDLAGYGGSSGESSAGRGR